MRCPRCNFGRSWCLRRAHRKCKRCRTEWSARAPFPVPDIHLTLEQWRVLIGLFLDVRSRTSIMERTGLGEHQVRSAVTHVRKTMYHDIPSQFSGVCEADETYVGGAWENKRAALRCRKRPRGRGTLKQGIFGILDRGTGSVRVWFPESFAGKYLWPLLQKHILQGSTIYTDDWTAYRRLPRLGYVHDFVEHAKGEYVRGDVHTQGLDGFWGILKRKLGAIGGIRKEHLPVFVGEQVWRFNHRNLHHHKQVQRLLEQIKIGGSNHP